MHNAIAPKDPAARRRIYRERREAAETARASGIPLDVLVRILLRNPEWAGGQIVPKGEECGGSTPPPREAVERRRAADKSSHACPEASEPVRTGPGVFCVEGGAK